MSLINKELIDSQLKAKIFVFIFLIISAFIFTIMHEEDIFHAVQIACQPTAMEAFRLEALVPPQESRAKLRDPLTPLEVALDITLLVQENEICVYTLLDGHWTTVFSLLR